MFCILIVEDDENTRKLMNAVFLNSGYRVFLAGDGIEAIDMMQSHHIDLVVLDLMMPRMDGYEFTKTLRRANNNIPILMVTAREALSDKKKGFLAGTDDYMVKP
ncbi:MAG: response regulator, partial [Spirochaetales bacterium]|nr:response regulator [Spirochaetales bacterium]